MNCQPIKYSCVFRSLLFLQSSSVKLLHRKHTWHLSGNVLKCALPAADIQCFPACSSCCNEPIRLSVRLACYQPAEITTQPCHSHANYEPSLQAFITVCPIPVFLSSSFQLYRSVSSTTCLLLCGSPPLLPVWHFPFRLTLHFTLVSLCVFQLAPVRWNIGALLMIQQSFLYLSIHLLLIVKLPSTAASCQAWSPFNSKAEGEPCSLTDFPCSPVTYTICTALITQERQIELVSGVTVPTVELDWWNIKDVRG